MPIEFNGAPPYEPFFAKSAVSVPSLSGVAVTIIVQVDGLAVDEVPETIMLEPHAARELAGRLEVQAGVVERLRNSSSSQTARNSH